MDGLLEDAKKLVMLPFSTLLDSFPIMVRNISRNQGKDVNLIMEGTDIEIDKRVLEYLKDPLIHLIRNSIDHGIEKPEDRLNKSKQGTLKVSVSKFSGNEIEITIYDDGRGININAVKLFAVKQGLISHEQFNQMDDQTALSLIFMSGLSTSPTITSVSGQGLGMAIVKEKIEIIGGHLELKSQLNIGTTITITMPLALTTFKGILIKVSDELFALPTSHLKKIIRIRPQEITTIENKESIFVDSTMLAFVKLCDILGLSQKLNSESNQFLQVVVIQSAGNSVAFQVDDIYGEQEILVKKLNKPLIRVNYILGATILENGDLVPILCVSD